MPSFRFLHAADLHVDSPLKGIERYEGAPVEAIRGASRRAVANLVSAAIEERVAFVVLAGDIFEGDWRDFGTGLFFAQQLRRLGEEGIEVFLLAGNHDAAAHMTRQLEWPANVTVFSTKAPQSVTHAASGTVLHGQGFATRAVEQDLAARYPEAVAGAFNIGVLHTALDGREGHDPYAPTRVETLRGKGYDYWALGHVHAREVVSREPWIVFPGNLQARHLRETGSKGATLVEVVDGRVSAVEHRPLDVVRFAQIDVDASGVKSAAAAVDRAQQAMTNARDDADGRLLVVRLHLHGRTETAVDLRREQERLLGELQNAANALGEVWLEGLRVDTTTAASDQGRDLLEALGLDDPDLRAQALREVRDGAATLLAAIREPGEDLDGLLASLCDDARDRAVSRLLDPHEGQGA
ncbi:MAG: DNA repair exonuclease [Planctomycetota bacterium]